MRIPSIDWFRGLAIFAVVVIHTEPFLQKGTSWPDWSLLGNAIQQLASFAVPYFFIVAGYFFAKGIELYGIESKAKSYALRILVVLVAWTIIDGIFWGAWLNAVWEARSIKPLLWNLAAIPRFAPMATANSPTRGHCKLPHLGDGTSGTLVGGCVLRNAGGGLLQPPALAVELQQVAVVHETVEERADHDDVAEQRGPVLEAAV